MRTILILLSFTLLSMQLWAQRQQVDKVIAVVGNEIILQSDIESQYKLLSSQSQGVDLPDNPRCMILDQLLSNALILAEANRDSVVVSDAEIQVQLDSRVSQILQYMGGDVEKFKQYYNMRPSEMKEFMRDQMEDQLVLQRMQQNIMSNITITPKEVKNFFKRIPKDSLPYFNSEVELAEIVIKPQINPSEDARARKLARNLLLQIVEDSVDFAQLARKYSDDPASAAMGGDLGPQPRGTLVPEFEATAYQLKKGEVSDVVKSQFGYHIIQLKERLGNTIDTRHILIRPSITNEDRQSAYDRLDSIRNLIEADSLTFAAAIAKFSEEEYSKTRAGRIMNRTTGEPYFELGDIDPEIYFAIDGLKTGDISKVIEYKSPTGDQQFRIVKIINRSEPHVANLTQDYSKIRKAALEEKKNRYINNWINEKIKKNYIEIKMDNLGDMAEETTNCEPLNKWLEVNALRP